MRDPSNSHAAGKPTYACVKDANSRQRLAWRWGAALMPIYVETLTTPGREQGSVSI